MVHDRCTKQDGGHKSFFIRPPLPYNHHHHTLLTMALSRIFKKRQLTTKDHVRTNAAELTLRQSIYPICLDAT